MSAALHLAREADADRLDALASACRAEMEIAAPDDTREQSGWMQGAAGVGSFLLHAHAVKTSGPGGRVRWPDEPLG